MGFHDLAVAPGGRAAVVTWRAAPPRSSTEVLELAVRERPGDRWATVRLFEAEKVHRPSLGSMGPRVAAGADGRMLAVWAVPSDFSHEAILARELPALGRTPGGGFVLDGETREGGQIDVGLTADGGSIAVWGGPYYAVPSRTGYASPVRAGLKPAGLAGWSSLDLAPVGAYVPAVAVAPDGTAVAVWRRENVGVEGAVRAPGGAFGPPESIGAGAEAALPNVAIDPSGTALAVWYQGRVMSASRPEGGTWTSPEPLSEAFITELHSPFEPPAVAIGDDGTAVVAWRRVVEGQFVIEARVRRPSAPWSPVQRISPHRPRNPGAPTVAVGGNGSAVIAWAQPVGRSGSTIRARALAPDAVRFGLAERPSADGRRATAPTVGLDRLGRATLAWRERAFGSVRGGIRTASRPRPTPAAG